MPSLMATRWVGHKSSLWTKVHRIKFACAGVSVVCNERLFAVDDILLHSGDIRNQVAKLCKITP